LNMKMRATVSQNRIQVVWPGYDCGFSKLAMSEDDTVTETDAPETGEDKKVVFCLVPGLRVSQDHRVGFVDHGGLTMMENCSFSSDDTFLPALVVTR
jgi:hypothetical protein